MNFRQKHERKQQRDYKIQNPYEKWKIKREEDSQSTTKQEAMRKWAKQGRTPGRKMKAQGRSVVYPMEDRRGAASEERVADGGGEQAAKYTSPQLWLATDS
jgi:hypothetical protein